MYAFEPWSQIFQASSITFQQVLSRNHTSSNLISLLLPGLTLILKAKENDQRKLSANDEVLQSANRFIQLINVNSHLTLLLGSPTSYLCGL